MKAGVKNIGITFLMTDSQVAQERFLVVVNDMLASGEIADLFPDDQIEGIIGAMRNEVMNHEFSRFRVERIRVQRILAFAFENR